MTQRALLELSATVIAAAIGWLLLTPPAHAQEHYDQREARVPVRPGSFSLKVEPGLAIPITRPQSQLFDVGGGQTVKALWALTPYLDIGPSATFIGLPADESDTNPGTAWTLGGGARLKRPHHVPGNALAAISPWVDVDILYVRTDELDRPGLAAGAGLALPIGQARAFWVGPFVRFLQIFSGQRTGFNDNDARILSLGVSLDVGPGVSRRHEAPPAANVAEIPAAHEQAAAPCPDRDRDGIPDSVDRCPDVVGTMDNFGCRQYEKIVVKPDKLELKEKLYFAWDAATLQEESYPVLDEVVEALNENKSFRVQVEGHSSSDGSDDHNQKLSEQRAQAVLDYLVAHGVDKQRLDSKGFSSSVPIDTNETPGGRENNRRVEFVVNFNIIDGGSN
jgi:outer membrane protein OmpA-like peptidoglycan-associated protein